jgi:hypothetical protein
VSICFDAAAVAISDFRRLLAGFRPNREYLRTLPAAAFDCLLRPLGKRGKCDIDAALGERVDGNPRGAAGQSSSENR